MSFPVGPSTTAPLIRLFPRLPRTTQAAPLKAPTRSNAFMEPTSLRCGGHCSPIGRDEPGQLVPPDGAEVRYTYSAGVLDHLASATPGWNYPGARCRLSGP